MKVEGFHMGGTHLNKPVYNTVRWVVGIEVSECLQYEIYLEIASRLGRRDAISFWFKILAINS